ncbi:F-type H+-transporting ATPase subunit alpha [Mycoplasmoides fastidiosum]|uniref:ATP synthase subunit alpha n=1 Tax=Mycoplasmoides fastidiosum TaxID=92758 RepID=A0ABU0LYU4_9BACT|nr:F0F1 ATP synthase subunit alpha [Mycoplasmoides fastidiosum]MDQ0513765.1 F-type H+-transporting ATPase subunit alpha [Mycoplasmoides fastidiosum]UUD37815.1 F0F1 ATP synthase subunit alpha [Mycoplasmoides fastidiosum]
MANSNLKLDQYSSVIRKLIEDYKKEKISDETGVVISNGDGIVTVGGLKECLLNELLEFDNGILGIAFSLRSDVVGVIMLNDYIDIVEGSLVKRTRKVVSVPVGDALLGRIVNALGQPIDDKGELKTELYSPIEKIAPGVMARKSVDQPLATGILSVDAMFPIGRGQRELIIGDRQTGKTAIALDAIINQKGQNCLCVYVAIGQKNSTIAQVINTLKLNGAMEYTTVVAASASDLPALKYIAPFAGVTIAEHWMHAGKDVLIIYDDLSKQAIAYRTLSLLLQLPPGREAYPGDVFYLHSRLLERAGRLNKENGGGSITALPIIETQAGDISAYIPTNVISITDGQLFTKSSLFNSGQRPAIDTGLSVSRVGSAAQIAGIRKLSGSLKLDLAQYNELNVFSQFGSDLDENTKKILEHGEKTTLMLRQTNNQPYEQVDEILLLYLIQNRFIKLVPLHEIQGFSAFAIKEFKKTKIRQALIQNSELSPEKLKVLKAFSRSALENYAKTVESFKLSSDELANL